MDDKNDPAAESLEAKAFAWTVRVQDPDFADWAGLSAWLAEDDRHSAAFDHASRWEEAVVGAVKGTRIGLSPEQTNADIPAMRPVQCLAEVHSNDRRRWLAIAATLVLTAGGAGAWLFRSQSLQRDEVATAYSTGAKQTREIELRDGTRVALAPETTIRLQGGGRSAILEDGQATFQVHHDARHPFSVRVGEALVTDIGTVFDIRRRGAATSVAVGRGEISVEARTLAIRLVAGQEILLGKAAPTVASVDPGGVGGWKTGSYSYVQADVEQIAADIQRATGAQIVVAPGVAHKGFAGSLQIGLDAATTLHDVAPALGVTVRLQGSVWYLDAARDPGGA